MSEYDEAVSAIEGIERPEDLREAIAFQWRLIRAIDEKIDELHTAGFTYRKLEERTDRIVSAQQFHDRATKAQRYRQIREGWKP